MPDTQKTQADLLTDFATNTTKSISAARLRNFVVSVPNLVDGLSAINFGTIPTATSSVNWQTKNFQKYSITGNTTFTFAAPLGGAHLTLLLSEDSTGNHTLTWPSTVIWSEANTPPPTMGANKRRVAVFIFDGSIYLGQFTSTY